MTEHGRGAFAVFNHSERNVNDYDTDRTRTLNKHDGLTTAIYDVFYPRFAAGHVAVSGRDDHRSRPRHYRCRYRPSILR